MQNYLIKKVIPVSEKINIKELKQVFKDKNTDCVGFFNDSKEICHYILRDDFIKSQRFNLDRYNSLIIATYADYKNIEVNNTAMLKKLKGTGVEKAVFLGKNNKEINNIVIFNEQKENQSPINLQEKYMANLPADIRYCLDLCSSTADNAGINIYLIGGVVRDIILGKKCFDIDITVQGNAIEFAEKLEKTHSAICRVKETHEAFTTAKVVFLVNNKKIDIDFASTRKESYPYPGSLPQIEEIGCDLYNDVARRDFTINSMALSINKKSFCELTDYLGGYKDLQKGIIQVLHPISYIDDPTRIIRALKFSVRFDFIQSQTNKSLQTACLKSGLFDSLAGERVKQELKQTLNLKNNTAFISFIDNEIFKLVSEKIKQPENINDLAENCTKTITTNISYICNKKNIWLIYLAVLLPSLELQEITTIAENLYLNKNEEKILLDIKQLFSNKLIFKNLQSNFDIFEHLENYTAEAIISCQVLVPELEEKIQLYFKKLKNIQIFTTGKDLIEMGLPPGPLFGKILKELLKAKLNGKIATEHEEKIYISNLLF